MSEAERTDGLSDVSLSRLADDLDHIRQAAKDACHFVEGMSKQDFLADKRKHLLADMIAQCGLKAAPPADLALWDVARPVGNEVDI